MAQGRYGGIRRRTASARRLVGVRWPRWVASLITCTLLLRSTNQGASAQEEPLNARVNYVYAAQFGFGTYEVGGMTVAVYSLPIGFTFDDVYRDWDLRLALPVTYGDFRFKTSFESSEGPLSVHAHVHSLAVEPKLQLDIPVFAGFRFSPLGAWGAGSTLDSSGRVRINNKTMPLNGNESFFYTYQLGYTCLYERDWLPFKLLLGNALIWAGDEFFDANNDVESYGTLRNGIEVRRPLGFEIAGRVPDGGLYFIYDHFFPSLEFTRVRRAALEVSNLFEVGVDIGAAMPLDLPWLGGMLDDLRLGIGYQAGDGLDAVKVTTGFPF